MDSATWCRTPAAASAARRLRPEVSKNSSTALSSNEGELARSITTCVPAMASLRPWPVMVLTPVLGEAATTSWPPWRRMATVFEPIRPVPPITTTFIPNLLVQAGAVMVVQQAAVSECGPPRGRQRASFSTAGACRRPPSRQRDSSPGPGMSATRNVPSTEVCRPRKSPATFGSAPPSSRHTRYDARPRVKVTGVLSPERGPRDTKGARGGIPDEAAGYSEIPQLSANLRDRNPLGY